MIMAHQIPTMLQLMCVSKDGAECIKDCEYPYRLATYVHVNTHLCVVPTTEVPSDPRSRRQVVPLCVVLTTATLHKDGIQGDSTVCVLCVVPTTAYFSKCHHSMLLSVLFSAV